MSWLGWCRCCNARLSRDEVWQEVSEFNIQTKESTTSNYGLYMRRWTQGNATRLVGELHTVRMSYRRVMDYGDGNQKKCEFGDQTSVTIDRELSED